MKFLSSYVQKVVLGTIGLSSLYATCFQEANAAGFDPKTMQDTFESSIVDRWLVIGKGWLQFSLTGDCKVANGYWDDKGNAREFENAEWVYTTQKLNITYGLTRYSQLTWSMKTHYVSLQNEYLNTDTSQFGMGDPVIGYKYELFRSIKPLNSLAVYARYKGPWANESAGNYVGGPNTFQSFIFTTGTPDISLGAQLKRGFGPVAATLDLGYKYRASGIALYVLETAVNQFAMRIKPGDVAHGQLNLDVQLGPVFLGGSALFQHRQSLRIGNTSSGLNADRLLKEVIDSDGWSLDAGATLGFTIGNRIDIFAQAQIPLRGEDLQFFPIEDIQPTNGNTYSATMNIRF